MTVRPQRKRGVPSYVDKRAATTSTACTIQGIPLQIRGFYCDVISEACSSFVHGKTVSQTTNIPVSTVRSTTTKAGQCVNTTVDPSTATQSASVTGPVVTTTVHETIPESIVTNTLTGPAATVTSTIQLPDTTEDRTQSLPIVTVLTSIRLPDLTVTATNALTQTVTTTTTSAIRTATGCSAAGGVKLVASNAAGGQNYNFLSSNPLTPPGGTQQDVLRFLLTNTPVYAPTFYLASGELRSCQGNVLYRTGGPSGVTSGNIYFTSAASFDVLHQGGVLQALHIQSVAGTTSVSLSTEDGSEAVFVQCGTGGTLVFVRADSVASACGGSAAKTIIQFVQVPA